MPALNYKYMRYCKPFFFAFLLMAFVGPILAQGPWAVGKGHGFAQLGFSSIRYADIYDKHGDVKAVSRTNSDHTVQLFAETGLSKKLTVKLVVPLTIAAYNNNVLAPATGPARASLAGLGNITGGIKYTIQLKKWLLAPGLDISLPAGKSNNLLGLRNGYDNLTLLPYISGGTSGNKWYAYLKAGYGITTNGYTDFMGLNAEGGYKVIPTLWLSLVADVRLTTGPDGAFGKAERARFSNYAFTNFYVDDQAYIGIGLKAAYQFKQSKFGISAGVYGAAAGNNVAAAPSVNAGVFYKF